MSLLNFIADPVIIVDLSGNFLLMNNVFQEVTGFKNDEWIGKSSLETNILTLENKAVLIENLKKRNLGLHVEPYEVFFTGQTGRKKFYEVNAKKK